MNNIKIGILGGIGPQATGYFYLNLIDKLKSSGKIKSNQDYPQIIINSVNAPELTSEKVDNKMLAPYIKGVAELSIHKPNFIVMVCNTIHLYRDKIIGGSKYKNILSIRKIVKNKLPKKQKICILATPSTVKTGLYKYDNCFYQNPENKNLIEIGNIVNNYNSTGNTKKNKTKLIKIIKKQQQKGAEVFLTACTEISELLQNEREFNILSTLDILLDYVFKKSIAKK